MNTLEYRRWCREELEAKGTLVLRDFLTVDAIAQVVGDLAPREGEAYYAMSSHNVYLTPPDSDLPPDHPFNRQVISSKGLIADDQIPPNSPLRTVYENPSFRDFLCAVLGIDRIYSYADDLSSINVHFASTGRELGWHFDNSSFAVTMMLQTPEGGGVFEYAANLRNADAGEMAFGMVEAVLDGDHPVETLVFSPGDLVLFRGRNAMHRVTPTKGSVPRLLAAFAFNDRPGVALSESALWTFYGRTS
jgi:hypothetical protein